MARKKREFTTFNLSFLDIMSCGFGAVILVFLIMNHGIVEQKTELNEDLLSELNLLDEDVTEGTDGLVRLRNTLSDVDLKMAEAQGLATRIIQDMENYEAQIEDRKRDGYSDDSDIESLKAELASSRAELDQLRRTDRDNNDTNASDFEGEGNRQYLWGFDMSGDRIAILLDVSASMLADTLYEISYLRDLGDLQQRQASKWIKSVRTVDWLTANLLPNTQYQVITFNANAKYALPSSKGKWLEIENQPQRENVRRALRNITPSGGTSLINAFRKAQELRPKPDKIFLITDGLPTIGLRPPKREQGKPYTVSKREREKLFAEAIRLVPVSASVNILLAPLEADVSAAKHFWKLARDRKGTLVTYQQGWP